MWSVQTTVFYGAGANCMPKRANSSGKSGGKYVYYRCTHYKSGCNEPYVREEVLEEKFTDILRMIQFDEEVLNWIKTALKESHDDERRFHREVVDKLQKDYQRL